MEGQAPDRLRFYTPEGLLLPQTPLPPPPLLVADPLDTLRAQQADLAITADTPEEHDQNTISDLSLYCFSSNMPFGNGHEARKT